MFAGLGWKSGFWMNLCVFFLWYWGRPFFDFRTKKIQLWYIYRLFTILCFKPTFILVWHDTLFLVNEIKVGEGCSQFFHFIFLANFHWLASWQRMYNIKKQMIKCCEFLGIPSIGKRWALILLFYLFLWVKKYCFGKKCTLSQISLKIRTCGLIVAQQSCLATAVLLYSFLRNCVFVFLCLCNCVFCVFAFGHGSCILM